MMKEHKRTLAKGMAKFRENVKESLKSERNQFMAWAKTGKHLKHHAELNRKWKVLANDMRRNMAEDYQKGGWHMGKTHLNRAYRAHYRAAHLEVMHEWEKFRK